MAEDLRIDVGALLTAELAFIDRHGNYMAPWAVALDLAHRICQTMPGLVLARIDGRERELRENASRGTRRRDRDGLVWQIPPERYAQRLGEREPIFALVRQWCGVDHERFDELEALRKEVDRLAGLVEQAIKSLQEFGHTATARRLRDELGVRVDSYASRIGNA